MDHNKQKVMVGHFSKNAIIFQMGNWYADRMGLRAIIVSIEILRLVMKRVGYELW